MLAALASLSLLLQAEEEEEEMEEEGQNYLEGHIIGCEKRGGEVVCYLSHTVEEVQEATVRAEVKQAFVPAQA